VVHWSAGLVHRYKLLNGIQSGLCVFIEILYHTGTSGGIMSLVVSTDMGFVPVSTSGILYTLVEEWRRQHMSIE
jgi:hypothetical protein